MPIRINLLAEAQAAEEDRRKDPVKRGMIVAGAVVSLVVLWAAALQVKLLGAGSRLSRLETQWKAIEKNYQVAADAQRKVMESEQKLFALHQMTTNRFLWGNALNAFQQTLGNIQDVRVVKLKAEQIYGVIEGTPNRTNGTTIIAGKPPTATEVIKLTIEARDESATLGGRIDNFKQSIAAVPYFRDSLDKTNGVRLTARGGPQSAGISGKQFVAFGLQCNFPEKIR
jgi:hypothetical protein